MGESELHVKPASGETNRDLDDLRLAVSSTAGGAFLITETAGQGRWKVALIGRQCTHLGAYWRRVQLGYDSFA